MQHFSWQPQLSDGISPAAHADVSSRTAVTADRATAHGAARGGDDAASIGLRSLPRTSIQGFSMYSQVVHPSLRSSGFPLHRRSQWPMMVLSVLLMRPWRPVPALPSQGARQRDCSTINTCIAANAPELEGLS
jgi:hypothetical protein